MKPVLLACAALAAALPAHALAQDTASELAGLRQQLADERAALDRELELLRARRARLDELEQRLAAQTGASAPPPAQEGQAETTGVETVGVAPEEADRPQEIAAIGQQGSAITRAGQLTADYELSYARADRNRAVFRGIEVVESVLVGVFDINESRQDVLTQTLGLRYGLAGNLELGVRLPFVARWDTSILAPVAGSTNGDAVRTVDNSANGFGVGDLELTLRHQLLAARGGAPFLIGNLQLDIPTGRGPFELARNPFGEARQAATGSGFWGVTPGLTAVLPSDPGVLFGTVSYTRNFARDVQTVIPPVEILRVDPGDALSFSAGVGFSLNPRLSVNFGYAHSWGFGTTTHTRLVEGGGEILRRTSRDLQIGRFLFGTTYRLTNRSSLNWNIELGATDDATDLRMVLRIPMVLLD